LSDIALAPLDVVGAVIRDDAGLVLCALRGPGRALAGLWEFPGGKVGAGEPPEAALVREIREELTCEIVVRALLVDHTHAYPGVTVRLRTYEARVVAGEPRALEHAELRWLSPAALGELDWAPADVPTIARLLADDA
jgi:8-oxo-dGTP diphosphatase